MVSLKLPFLIVWFFFLICGTMHGQIENTSILWSKSGGGSKGYKVIETIDSNLVVIGYSGVVEVEDERIFVVKFDSDGNILDSCRLGIGVLNDGTDIVEVSDGFIFVGGNQLLGSYFNGLVGKMDSDLDSIWFKTYGDTLGNYFLGMTLRYADEDSGFFAVGLYHTKAGDGWVLQCDSNGDSILSHTFGGSYTELFYDICLLNDTTYVLCGSKKFSLFYTNPWVFMIDADNDSLWSSSAGMYSQTASGWVGAFHSISTVPTGGLIASGSRKAGAAASSDFFLVRMTAEGDCTWAKTYGGASDDICYGVIQDVDSGFIMVGLTQSYGVGGQDAWIVKTDSLGDSLWSMTIGTAGNDYAQGIISLNDTTYIVTGNSDGHVLILSLGIKASKSQIIIVN